MNSLTNYNSKNTVQETVYKSFNDFIFSQDIKVLGKLLWRHKFFEMVKDLPGDVVEVGVFKGSGLATFQKFFEIFYPNSIRKVIGFDIFNGAATLESDPLADAEEMKKIYARVSADELSLEAVKTRLASMNLSNEIILVDGDVQQTLPKFVEENPGFRVSLLYIDVDIERPTYLALKHLWNRIVTGGVIVFDEYEYHKFSECKGVEKFMEEFNIPLEVRTTHFMSPTAYIIKK
jgi:hypothetical protein